MKHILDRPEDYERISEFVYSHIGLYGKPSNFTAIGLEQDGKIIAGVVYADYNGSNITASIAVDGRLTPEFIWFMFYYPFMQAGAKRITACVETNNYKSQRFVEKLGFELEFSMKRAGRFGDLLIYRMFHDNCKYLEERYGRSSRRQRITTTSA